MAKSPGKRIVIVAAGVVVAIVLGVGVVRYVTAGQVHTIYGTITRIDVQTRKASIEYVHPKTGRTLQIDGTVPRDCDIQIDGEPASLSDLRVGEQAEVEGTIHRDMTISANWVRVTRSAGAAATAPATKPSAEDP